MKNLTVMAALALVCVGGGYGLYRFGVNQGKQSAASGALLAATGGKTPLYWQDPMHPGQKFDKPGKSPFMDMQLAPVYADADGDIAGKVSISSRVQQNLGIRTGTVILGKLSATLVAVGSVAYDERDVALVQARSSGFVERLHVRAPLERVSKGQPLADLYVPDWIAAQEEYLAVRRMPAARMDGMLDGARQRMRLAGMSDDQIALIDADGKVHPRITIVAPQAGAVAELAVREGMAIATGAPMFRINGLSTVWVNAEVPENFAARVRPGNAVEARVPALPGMVFKGKVNAILPEVNPVTRTLKARIELANPNGELVPGMFATVDLRSAPRDEVLLAPSEAVIQTGARNVVMVALANGAFMPVEVEIGSEAKGLTEIRKGLEAGQKVVVSGQFLIDSEASLKGLATRTGDAAATANSGGTMK